jgi:hypothetical protein
MCTAFVPSCFVMALRCCSAWRAAANGKPTRSFFYFWVGLLVVCDVIPHCEVIVGFCEKRFKSGQSPSTVSTRTRRATPRQSATHDVVADEASLDQTTEVKFFVISMGLFLLAFMTHVSWPACHLMPCFDKLLYYPLLALSVIAGVVYLVRFLIHFIRTRVHNHQTHQGSGWQYWVVLAAILVLTLLVAQSMVY